MSKVQQVYESSVRAAATRAIDRMFDASADVCATFRQLSAFLGAPHPLHPVARQSEPLAVVAREMRSWHPAASVRFARQLVAHMKYHYGHQAASADYTIRLERLLERMQQRQMQRLTEQGGAF